MLAVCHEHPCPTPLFQTTLYYNMKLLTFAPIPVPLFSPFPAPPTILSRNGEETSHKLEPTRLLYFTTATLKIS